ncbi:hypothetical protein SAMN04488057_105259 [Cyclobacterium lianum]|uniref:O-antigen ligase like membrane protein n=1 Tax=Cyclobacterium lianum TaxID=388280 RepID=A0A1M7NEN7_9BACT|nr:hypothetical protein [Cyclobacterium lianum]SHN02116.1 hypothetical protein SAMN04488057_105259 [Cyclobacterium lianum]
MKEKITIVYIILLVIISLNFFDATFLNPTLVNYLDFIAVMGTVLVSARYMFDRKGGLVLPVQIIALSIVFSMVMAYYSWGQGFKDSMVETYQYMLWFLFFLLLHLKTPIRSIEKIILAYGLLYAVLYFFQYLNAHTVFFGKPISGEEFTEERGAIRIIFPGAGIFILSVFIAITKLSTNDRNKWWYLGLATLGLVIPVMQVTRQFIVGVLLIYFYHFVRNQTILKKALILGSFAAGMILLANSDIPMVRGVVEAQQRDAKLGKDYIRVKAGEYFLTDFSPNTLSQIFGNGSPNWGISNYGKFIERLSNTHEYFISDVGIIAVYTMFGIFAVVGFISLWYKSFVLTIPRQYAYTKYYLWYLLITSFTSSSVYHYHYIIATVFALYIFHRSFMENKKWTFISKLLDSLPSKSDRFKTKNFTQEKIYFQSKSHDHSLS